jgi:hypothetical protein
LPQKKTESQRGDGSHSHSEKAKKMMGHIDELDEKRGVTSDRAEEIALGTVDKELSHEEKEK